MKMSVSLINGHIDPDKKGITRQQAIKYFEDEILMLENAPNLNGCEMTDEWREQLEICKMAKQALEKRIPKKPVIKTHKYIGSDDDFVNRYHCPVCNALIINEDTNGFYAGRKQKHCDCGQALDWSDTE
jgi:hypothetical protein